MTIGVSVLTVVHTLLSIVALLAGIAVVRGLTRRAASSRWTSWFLFTASATTLTGFFFPFHGVTPAIAVGVVAAIVLIAVFVARPRSTQARGWSVVQAVGLVISEYLLIFVAIAQAFTKVPALHALAPTLKEPPFGISQLVALAIFVVLGVVAVVRTKRSVAGVLSH